MKDLWVEVRPWRTELATTAIESGADALVVDRAADARALGRITTVAPDGDLVWDRDVFSVTIEGKEDEERAVSLSGTGIVVVDTSDWTVIPLENLVSRSERIYAAVRTVEEAEVALHVLEKGVRGLLLRTDDPGVVARVAELVKGRAARLDLVPFIVTAVRPAGMGDRVCVDTCSLLADGEGMLVGNTSSAFLLVHAETLENPYVAPRPFRVNAGAVHAYVLRADGTTAYLSELKTGDRALVVGSDGSSAEATVGRVKIERRPLLIIEAAAGGSRVSLVLQNAETIRLVREDGTPVSVVELAVGDRVLGSILAGGRHLGVAVEETILEK
jgi:3-dehydroquinate synthase II